MNIAYILYCHRKKCCLFVDIFDKIIPKPYEVYAIQQASIINLKKKSYPIVLFFQDIMTFEKRPTIANAILCNTFLMDISLTFLHCKAITVMGLCP